MTANGGEFSFHEMEEIKRKLAGSPPSASKPGATVAGISAPPDEAVAPQELFSRSRTADMDSLQLARMLRGLRRHWMTVSVLIFLFPTIMYLYDSVLNRPNLPAWLRVGAERRYLASVGLRQVKASRMFGNNLARPDPVALEELDQVFQFKEFHEDLRRLIEMDYDADRDIQAFDPGKPAAAAPPAGVQATLPPALRALIERYLKSGKRVPPVSFSTAILSERLVRVEVMGKDQEFLAYMASKVAPALNAYFKKVRKRRLQGDLDDYEDLAKQSNAEYNKIWEELHQLNQKLNQGDSRDNGDFIIRDLLGKKKFELELALTRLGYELAAFKESRNYAALIKKFGIRTSADINKVLVNGHPLRVEWAKLASELTRLKRRYTADHPAIRRLRDDVEAIRKSLKDDGWVTAGGKVPPLPKQEEDEALRYVAAREQQIKLNQKESAHIQKRLQEAIAREREKRGGVLAGKDELLRRDKLRGKVRYHQEKTIAMANKAADLQLALGQAIKRDEFEVTQPPAAARQISPNVAVDVAVALLIGLLLGCGLAFLFENLDNRLHTPADVYYHLRLNYLGVIPCWSEKDPVSISPERPDSHIAEVFAHLCNNIRYARSGNPEKRLLIASAQQGEGKSTIAVNLAIRYALESNTVLLIDCDLRRPRGQKLLDSLHESVEGELGLCSYLVGEASFEQVVHPTVLPGLSFIPVTERVRNPAKLLGSPAMLALLDKAEDNFDMVIVDCPAVLPVVDATILAPHMRGILMVIAAEEVDIGAARMALYRLQHVGAPLAGAVLNKVREHAASYAYYGYRYRSGYYYSPYTNGAG